MSTDLDNAVAAAATLSPSALAEAAHETHALNDHEHCADIGSCWQERYACPAGAAPATGKLPPPRIEDAARAEKGRSVDYAWELGSVPGDRGERTAYAELSIAHHKAGPNYFTGEQTTEDYFSVSISRYYTEQGDGYTVRGFTMFNGLGLGRVPAGNRYSAKKLREAEQHGIAVFERLIELGDERVLAYFDKNHDPKLGR